MNNARWGRSRHDRPGLIVAAATLGTALATLPLPAAAHPLAPPDGASGPDIVRSGVPASSSVPTRTPAPRLIKGAYIVTLRAPAAGAPTASSVRATRAASVSAAAAARRMGATVTRVYGHALSGYAARLTTRQVATLRKNPQVKSVVPDAVEHISAVQDNPPSWGLDRIDQEGLPLDAKYTFSPFTGAGVNVFVVDTGIRAGHVEFAGRMLTGFTAVGDGRGTGDCNGHGTHVAGTIAGATLGVAKGASLVPVRVGGCSGSASSSSVVAGVDWIVRERAAGRFPGSAVINMSMGHKVTWWERLWGIPQEDALKRAVAAGITVVVAAGNDNANACNQSPARVQSLLTIAATGSDDVRASYSNRGSCVDLFAPGTDIVSAGIVDDASRTTKSGTSMAAPHVAGAAARYLQEHPGQQPGVVGSSLQLAATSDVVVSPGTGTPNRLLRVSRPGLVVVPHVLGESCASASAVVEAEGLVPVCVGRGTYVASQTPFPGTTVAHGTVVRLSLRSGPIP